MKVFLIVLMLAVVAVYALPVEEKIDNENLNTLTDLEADQLAFDDEVVRDKRQYGGKQNSYLDEDNNNKD